MISLMRQEKGLPTTAAEIFTLPDNEKIFAGKLQPTNAELKLFLSVIKRKSIEPDISDFCGPLVRDEIDREDFYTAVSRWNENFGRSDFGEENSRNLQGVTLTNLQNFLTRNRTWRDKAILEIGRNYKESISFLAGLR